MAELIHERYIEASPEVVFAMFTEPDQLTRWIGDTAELDPRPGGLFRFTLAGQDSCRGVYLEVDPPRRVVFSWGWEQAVAIPVPAGSTTVEVSFSPEGTGTRLRLVHRGLEGDPALLHDHGWSRFLDRLEVSVAGPDPTDDPTIDSPAEVLARIRKET